MTTRRHRARRIALQILYRNDLGSIGSESELEEQVRYLSREEVMAESILDPDIHSAPEYHPYVELPESAMMESLLKQLTPEEQEVEKRVREILRDQERRAYRKQPPRPTDPEVDQLCEFALRLVRGVREFKEEIDQRIQQIAKNWRIERMSVVDRNILRLATYELLYIPDIPPKVSIDEAVELAKEYSEEKSSAFVNGILDKVAAFRLKEKNGV